MPPSVGNSGHLICFGLPLDLSAVIIQLSEWVTVSIGGITIIPEADKSYDFYLKIADAMLYDAKTASVQCSLV